MDNASTSKNAHNITSNFHDDLSAGDRNGDILDPEEVTTTLML